MAIPVPSLSASGWVTEIAEKADKLFANFFVSDYSQSNFYRGTITSLPYMVRQWGNDRHKLGPEMEDALHRYLSRYFEEVQVTVNITTDNNATDPENSLSIEVDALVSEGGKRHSIGHLISTMESKVVNIMKINNG